MIHIGKHIESILHSQGKSISWFAGELCCSRRNVYKIFNRKSINTSLLWKISKVLHHNFFSDLSSELTKKETISYGNPTQTY